MNELVFGVAYYPEYMPYDRIETDITMIKNAGMNTIRIAESTWSTLEPREGVFDFSYIDKTIEIAKKYGINVIIGTPTYAVPSWLVKKDPEVMLTDSFGQKKYGRRQIMDIMNRTYRKYSELVIRKLMEHTANESCVIGFQIDNETKHYGTAGKNIQELFKEYLIHKFETTQNLNKTFYLQYWSNSILSWDDLPDMKGCINGGLASEFEQFQRNLACDFLAWQASIVSEYKREDQFITHNLDFEWKKFGAEIAQDGYSYGVQPDIDHNQVAKELTIVGTDIYHPTQKELTGAEIAFCGDEIRSLKQENYLVLECQAQAFKYWTPFPGQLKLHAYSHLASGATGLMYWNWHSIHNGYETYWKGVLSHNLKENQTYYDVQEFGQEWQRITKEKLVITKKNKIAIVVDNKTLTMFKWFPIDKELSYNDVVRWVYDSLFELNIECDIVHADELDTTKYEVIITPALYCARESLIEQLKEFTGHGGTLISTFKSFVSNEFGSVYYEEQPYKMTECFGMTYDQFVEPEDVFVKNLEVTYFAELIKARGAKIEEHYQHPYWKKYAAITKNTYKKGVAYYIACYFSKDILKEILVEALEQKGIYLQKEQWPIVKKCGYNLEGNMIEYVFNYSMNETNILCDMKQATELLTNKKYKFGETISIKDWGVLVLEKGE
ncbi:MAG: beta-galactosidase [Lachnospiraceae bacterium]